MFSDTGHNWKQYRQEDSIGAFPGNSNADSVVQHKLQHPVIARYVRLIPLDWNPNGRIGLRLETYGCPYNSDVVSFDGRSSLLYRLSPRPRQMTRESISLNFKTLRNSGILLHAEGQSEHSLTLELESGKLLLVLRKGRSFSPDSQHLVSLGSLLDDQHWHHIAVEHHSSHLNLTVDKSTLWVQIPPRFTHWDHDQMSVGADQGHGSRRSVSPHRNFHGCLENLVYNALNLVDLAKQNDHRVTVKSTHIDSIPCLPGRSFSPDSQHLVSLGSLLDDQHWHHIAVEHHSSHLNLTVDKSTLWVQIPPRFTHWDHDQMSVGADQGHGSRRSVSPHRNFHGCLENLVYNALNLVDLAKQNDHRVTVKGNVTFSCAEPVFVAMTFTSPQSFLWLPGVTEPSSLGTSVGLQFRTWNKAGLLLTFDLPKQGVVVWLYLSKARLHLQIHKSGKALLELSAGSALNDGQWHSVELISRRGQVTVAVDGDEGASAHASPSFLVSTGSQLFFGGCPAEGSSQECMNPFKTFQGCMRLLTVDNQPVDLIMVQQRLIGNYSHLQIDMCGIIDRCSPSHCEHGGSCSQSWSTFHCNCSSTGYSGATCQSSIYEQSCEAYKHKGNTSGYYNIDVDGSGPIRPQLIYCNMTDDITWMVIQHNNTELTRVRPSPGKDQHSAYFEYASEEEQLAAIISHSEHCEQEVTYHCRKSRLLNTPDGPPLSCRSLANTWPVYRWNKWRTSCRERQKTESSTEVLFSFDVGNGPLEVRVKADFPLNDNRWHRIRAERNVKEASLRLDELPAATQEAPADGHIHLQLNSQLFIGGTASRQKGFRGCIRSLQLNGITLDLEERAKITPGVQAGCPGHCSSYGSLCQNQGLCVERPNSFSCDCGPSAYTGAFCDREVSASFKSGTSVSYTLKEPALNELNRNSSALPSSIYSDMTLRAENISLRFRTSQSPALLLYVSSYHREYLALLLNKHDKLEVRYRLDSSKDADILRSKVTNLANGQLHAVTISRLADTVSVQIDQNNKEDFNLTFDVEFNGIRSLVLGRVLDSGELDPELSLLASLGFTGCLSAVLFNSISPLKAALLSPATSPVVVTGPLVQSICGSTSANPYAAETTHHISGQSGSVGTGQPLVNAIRSDSVLIGGTVAAIFFSLSHGHHYQS
ncbi:contactin-associated protein-like 4 [Micropterus dolomieu]|uniref:contactin-associated protein-like 4 n=1 Tax=Micropterus dolomieu TaxID=147949 RepID=UPI001E8CAAA6|nr:contactin-associated protein-like 4 [Micropterus dolomieu]